MRRILLLGGTTEASALAQAFAGAGLDAVYSYAGRTRIPAAQPLPLRVGGFGGIEGLADYLRREGISHVVDATHPFAAGMSRNAAAAAAACGVALIGFERAIWREGPGDEWRRVADVDAAVAALPEAPACVFLGIGRQQVGRFAARPEHRYLLRLVDAPQTPPLAGAEVVVARGPFTEAGDRALFAARGVTHVVAKDAGGAGARAKLDAARTLGLPVILIDRPVPPLRAVAHSVGEVMHWLHAADRGV